MKLICGEKEVARMRARGGGRGGLPRRITSSVREVSSAESLSAYSLKLLLNLISMLVMEFSLVLWHTKMDETSQKTMGGGEWWSQPDGGNPVAGR